MIHGAVLPSSVRL